MGYYKYFIKQIIKKIPIKLLIIILITLLILSICLSCKAYSFDSSAIYNNYLDCCSDLENNNIPIRKWSVVHTNDNGKYMIIFTTSQNGEIWVANYRGQLYLHVRDVKMFCYYANNTLETTFTFGTSTAVGTGTPEFLYSSDNILNWADNGSVYFPATLFSTNPSITTSSTDIENWSFDNLEISLGSVSVTDSTNNINAFGLLYTYTDDYNSFDDIIQINQYLDTVNKTFSIPKNRLLSNVITDNFSVSFSLSVRGYGISELYDLSSYNITISSSQATNSNDQQQLQAIQNVNNSINNLNNSITNVDNSINNINDVLTDDSYDSSLNNTFLDLSNGFSITDNTGIEQLFTILYNAFCNNSVVDLTFTLPFVNKQVTINSSNISAYYPEALKNIVALFVWGSIGLFILKDIRTMINKIAEGNIENISSDVKKEVL